MDDNFTEAMKLLLEIKEYCKNQYAKSNNLINNGTEYDCVDFRYEQGRMRAYKDIHEMLTSKYISGEVK